MYQLVSAVGRSRLPGSRWVELEIGDMQMATIYADYEEVHAVLTNNFIVGELGLNLESIKPANLASTQTFNEFLTGLGNASLPTTTKKYKLETREARYADAFRALYKIEPVTPGGHPESTTPTSEKKWLSLTKQGVDYQQFFRSCLVSVNGFIHRTDTNGQRVYVADGMTSCRVSNSNQLGILSFLDVGALDFIPIEAPMIHRRHPDMPYRDNMYIDCGVDLSNKTVLLVLGGYLHVLDEKTFTRVGDSIFCINFQNFPLRDRYFESVDRIDLSSLGLDHTSQNSYQISDAQLHSDEVLTKYATLSQSFLVVLDVEDLFVEKVGVEHTRSPYHYISFVDPVYPLVVGVGKFADYWRTYEDLQWSLATCEPVRGNYVYNTTPESTLHSIDNSREPGNPCFYGRAHLLRIGADLRIETGA